MNNITSSEFKRCDMNRIMSEINDEFILPDSYPDVKLIHCASAKIESLDKYFGANELEISGIIVYSLLFSSDMGEKDEFYSVEYKNNFKVNCKYKDPAHESICAHTTVKCTNAQTLNPRKFSLKSVLETLVFENMLHSVYPKIKNENISSSKIEYLTEKKHSFFVTASAINGHSFSDNIELDIKAPEIENIVYSDTSLRVYAEPDKMQGDDKFRYGGVFSLNCLYSDALGEYHNVVRDIPFNISLDTDELTELDGACDNMIGVMCAPHISAVNLSIGKNRYDESKVLEFDADYDIDLCMISACECEYVLDCYSTEGALECDYEKVSILSPSGVIRNNFTFSESNDAAFVQNEETEYGLCYFARPYFDDISIKNGEKYENISGKICFKNTYMSSDCRICSEEKKNNISYRVGSAEKEHIFVGDINADSFRSRFDKKSVYTDAEIYLDLVMFEENELSVCKNIKDISLYESAKENCAFKIYYPDTNENVWQAAKKNRTSVDTIMKNSPTVDENKCLKGAIIID